jgi:hypothetical protein
MGQSFAALCMDGVCLFLGGLSFVLFSFLLLRARAVQEGAPLHGFALCFCKIAYIPLDCSMCKQMF